MRIKLMVGVGNPDEQYQNTRHNVGFMFLDFLIKNLLTGKINKFPTKDRPVTVWEFDKKTNSLITKADSRSLASGTTPQTSRSKASGKSFLIILAKPQTYVNKSGEAIKKLILSYKLKIENLIVVHDDLDIPFGNTKISFDKNSGGHKGVESIIKALKTKKFYRLRIGLAKTSLKKARQQPDKKRDEFIRNYVLSKFTPTEKESLENIFNGSYNKLASII